MMKLIKGKLLIDQHNKNYLYGRKFGGNYVPETLKKPIEDLANLFEKLRRDKKFLNNRDYYFKNYVGVPTLFFKLKNHKSFELIFFQDYHYPPNQMKYQFFVKFLMPPSDY